MSPVVLIGLGVLMLLSGSLFTQYFVKRVHGIFTEETMDASQGNRTVPTWVSLLVIFGWPVFIAGVLWALAAIAVG